MNRLYYIRSFRVRGLYTDNPDIEGTYTNIEMTAGGGMGGSRWNIYTKNKIELDELQNNRFIEVTNITGKKRIINTNFITEVNEVYINYDEDGKLFDKHDGTLKLRW